MKNKRLLLVVIIVVVLVLFFVGIKGLFNKKEENKKEEYKVVFVSEKASKDANVQVSKDGKTITFTTPGFKNNGDSSTLSFKLENKGNADVKINGIVCTAKGVYKDPNNKTDEEIKNAEKNAIDYSNYVTAGLSNNLANTKLEAGKISKKETLTINVTRELKDNKGKSIVYECVIDSIKK